VKNELGVAQAGLVMGPISKMVIFNSSTSRLAGLYNPAVDGDTNDAVLCVPVRVDDVVWCAVSRPFELADRWCDILNEEFFHQGDLEKESGIGLTSPLNDRTTSNKPKSQIGFYNFICLPLYTVVAKLFPPLQVNVDNVRSNLDKWKAIVAAQAPPS
jgi:hypothetical protein